MNATLPAQPEGTDLDSRTSTDLREQLFNDGAIGPISHIQMPAEAITSLHGTVYDIDIDLLMESSLIPTISPDPAQFYRDVLSGWLCRNPVLAKAEVRNSGRGLHVILRLDQPVEFHTDGERNRWAGIVQAVQAALPIDPDQPGITATTRAVGSVNSKNGKPVELLAAGLPVTKREIFSLFEQMNSAPFKTVLQILAGGEIAEPCPICRKADKQLVALDHVGRCYKGCGQVTLEKLFACVLQARPVARQRCGET